MKNKLKRFLNRCVALLMGGVLATGMYMGNGIEAKAASSAGIHGVNWADRRDNYADDNLILSGLSASDSYSQVQAKSDKI